MYEDFDTFYAFQSDKCLIGRDLVQAVQEGEIIAKGNADIFLRLLPSPQIEVSISTELGAAQLSQAVLILSSGVEVGGYVVRGSTNNNGAEIIWNPSAEPCTVVGDKNSCIDEVIFHLFNFPKFLG